MMWIIELWPSPVLGPTTRHRLGKPGTVVPRSARMSPPHVCARFRPPAPVMARSRRGITQAGVRWNSTRRATSGWISGTIWIADAPVPTTATRLPSRRAPWSQRAEWKTSPGKVASPGMSGRRGSESGPAAEMTTSAVRSPWPVRSRQRAGPASQRASVTSAPNRRWPRRPWRVGDALQVVPDLWLPGEAVRPVRVRRERERVQVRRDVAGTPGVGVVPPRAAQTGRPLEDDEVGHARLPQPDPGAEPAETGADHGGPHMVRGGRRRRRRGGVPGLGDPCPLGRTAGAHRLPHSRAPARSARPPPAFSVLGRRRSASPARVTDHPITRMGRRRGQTGSMRVVVTRIDWDGTMRRRVVDTAGRSDAGRWEELIARALAVRPPYRPAPGGPVYHLRVDNGAVLVAEHDLSGALSDLVTAVLAIGEAM